MATPDARLDVIARIELEPMGRGHWNVVLVRTSGVVLSGTTRYPAESIEQALAITEAWMRDATA
jgi:hypothetical protein